MLDNTNHLQKNLQSYDSYTDLHQLQGIRKIADKDYDLALRKVSEQFESLFLKMMLKSMRDANAVFSEDNPLNSFEMKHHQEMYDNQLSLTLSGTNKLGIADALFRQLQRDYGNAESENFPSRAQELSFSGPYINYPQSARDEKLLSKMDTSDDFVKAMTPYAKEVASEIGVDYKAIIAQAALETGWGKHIIKDKYGKQSFNIFNIKANENWQGKSIAVSTLEYSQGVAAKESARFKRYDSIDESFKDYLELLQKPRYKQVLNADNNNFANALQQSGYATDPEYAEKINAILERMAL